MEYTKKQICCFSGHRPEKMAVEDAELFLRDGLERAIRRAAQAGYTAFMTGMSRGFDLWAAREVLALRKDLGLLLWCVVPYLGQEVQWEAAWQTAYRQVLLAADRVFCLQEAYTADCFHKRNRFMVEGAGRLICYLDGRTGGTAFTVQLAREGGLEIDNLADRQLIL